MHSQHPSCEEPDESESSDDSDGMKMFHTTLCQHVKGTEHNHSLVYHKSDAQFNYFYLVST